MKQYTIGEFAEIVGVTAYTLRYYEQLGLIIPSRDGNDRRYYTEQDARWVAFLIHLKKAGMSMSEMGEYVRLRAMGDETIPSRRDLLQRVHSRSVAKIHEMQNSLVLLNHKIDWYDGVLDRVIDEDFESYVKQFNGK